MGIGALVRPTVVTRQFGIPALTPEGRSEVRAVYGGFGLAVAAMLVVAVTSPDLRAGIAITVAVALFGMAVGRVVSAVIDRSLSKVVVLYLVIEVVAGVLLVLAR
ncbi:MAG: hypothetical protein B7C55_04095 [Actinomycetales bacterium mxb001]|nr:MAG: hypothetical protein B7C55_04095 [Actinomycetales bacterium mxb001]